MPASREDHKRKRNAVDGPDYYDIADYIANIDKMHGVTLSFRITHTFDRLTSLLRVELHAGAPVLVSEGKAYEYRKAEYFPHYEHKTLPGLMYRLLNELDFDASRLIYQQRELPLDG